MKLDDILSKLYPLPNGSKTVLMENVTEVHLPKKHILIIAGKVEPNIYFIKKGIARAYAEHRDGETTFWLGKEGDTIVSMQSYVSDQSGYENIELLEDCELFKVDMISLKKLFSTDIHLANWGRKFAEYELIKTERRLISMQLNNASERYKELMTVSPDILQRVQLRYIASYLGITQVTLSRIRAEIK